MELVERIGDRLVEVFGDNKWLCATEISQSSVGLAAAIKEFGASDVFALAAASGVGPIDESVPLLTLGLTDQSSMMESIRAAEAGLTDVPADIQSAIDEWDPEGAARVLGGILHPKGRVAGRPTFGCRPPEWMVLEDKLQVGDVFVGAGLAPPLSVTVELNDRSALLSAFAEMRTAEGVVAAGDNRSGWHGGASSTRWIPDEAAIGPAADQLAVGHDAVRVMPFLEGVPCSIHGLVLADGTAAFRPMELLVFRDRNAHAFVYGKAASLWDPTPDDRAEMRAIARKVGDHLRDRVDYRGVFTIDGVMTADGFVVTEINTRFGGALPARLHVGEPVLRLGLMHMAAVEGHFDDFDPHELEEFVTDDLDTHRYGTSMVETDTRPDTEATAWLTGSLGDLQWHVEDPGDGALAKAAWGQSPRGGLVFIHLSDEVSVGESAAPLVLEIRELANQAWSLNLPELEPAAAVR